MLCCHNLEHLGYLLRGAGRGGHVGSATATPAGRLAGGALYGTAPPAIGAGPVISGSASAGSAADGPEALGGAAEGIGAALAVIPRLIAAVAPSLPIALSLPVRRWRRG